MFQSLIHNVYDHILDVFDQTLLHLEAGCLGFATLPPKQRMLQVQPKHVKTRNHRNPFGMPPQKLSSFNVYWIKWSNQDPDSLAVVWKLRASNSISYSTHCLSTFSHSIKGRPCQKLPFTGSPQFSDTQGHIMCCIHPKIAHDVIYPYHPELPIYNCWPNFLVPS